MTLTADVAWLTETLPVLAASRIKGTPRPWREPQLTPTQRAQLNERAQAERHRPTPVAPGLRHLLTVDIAPTGEHPAPLHIDVLELVDEITRAARKTAIDIATEHGHLAALPEITSPTTPVGQLLAYITRNADPHHESPHLHHLRVEAARHFQQIVVGQRLKTDCPWCGHPRLFFRAIGPEHKTEVVIRCDSGVCDPPEADCGKRHQGRPCWPFHEWEWLANRIDHARAKQAT